MSIIEKWLKGETPQIALTDEQSETFFKELTNHGFKRSDDALQVHGLSGVYYLDQFEDDKGNVVSRRYGGRRPTMIDIWIPARTTPHKIAEKDNALEDHKIIKLLEETISND